MSIASIIVIIVITVEFSLIPFFITMMRGHNNLAPIFLICLFFGWSCIGWIIALVWSFSDNTRANRYRQRW
ncbi:superinfection immunity protein [Zavarzinella formosa]|uniref:superinfection immunity protein n=1 Tax=Zavarzinella formosa TaxID=360055 RepID=UPI0005946AB4